MSRVYESCLKSLPQGCPSCVFNDDCAEKQLYEKGRADQIEEDNEFFNFEDALKRVRADAIDEYKKKIEFERKWLLCCKVFDKNVDIVFNTLISYAEKLKEQK